MLLGCSRVGSTYNNLGSQTEQQQNHSIVNHSFKAVVGWLGLLNKKVKVHTPSAQVAAIYFIPYNDNGTNIKMLVV
jgi:hypothetical protein